MAYFNKTFVIGDVNHNSLPTGSIHYIDESCSGNLSKSQEITQTQDKRYHDSHLEHRTDNEPGWLCRQLSSQCSCGPSSWWAGALSDFACLLACWALLAALLGPEALPGGGLFALAALILAAHFAGWATAALGLPPLLGMLFAGIVARSTGLYHVTGAYVKIVYAVRDTSLALILIQAGLGMNPVALLNLSFAVARLAVFPGLMEATAVAVSTHLIFGYPWLWGFSLGFLLCATSRVVMYPSILKLKKEGYGESKGISTLVIAATSMNNILAISTYSITMSIIFSTGDSLTMEVLRGPIDIVLELAAGIAWGLFCAFVPHLDDKLVVLKRAVMVGGGATAVVMGCPALGFSGAGLLFAITGPFVASTAWATQGWVVDANPVQEIFSWLWMNAEPVIFALTGASIDLSVIQLETVTWGLIVVAVSQAIRALTCSLVLLGGDLNLKEILFVNLAWLPKATVQAALAPQAVAMAASASTSEPGDTNRALQCLTIAVLSILVTAPLGALGASLGGPRLLSRETPPGSPRRDRRATSWQS